MKDEIKETLDSIQEHLKEKEENFKKGAVDSTVYYLYCDDARILLDYITNLQKENEILRKNAEHNDKVVDKAKWNEMIYKSRNEKAIEYIKQSIDNPQPFYEYLFGDENGKVENLDKLLNILQGDDDNE